MSNLYSVNRIFISIDRMATAAQFRFFGNSPIVADFRSIDTQQVDA